MKNMKLFVWSFLFLLFWSVTGQTRQITEKGKSNLDPKVRYGKLDNGFTYYLRHNETPANEVVLHFVVKAGFFQEEEDQLEYAHLMEHMGSFGTKHVPNVKDYFFSKGNRHAGTRDDHTYYTVDFLVRNREVLDTALEYFHDLTNDINLDQSLVDVQRGAILGEMRSISPHRQWMMHQLLVQVLQNTRVKPRDPARTKASIENFDRKAFLRYYSDWYRPDLEAAIIVGNLDMDSLETEIRIKFADLHLPQYPRDAQARVEENIIRLTGENSYSQVLDTVDLQLRLHIESKRLQGDYNPQGKADLKKILLDELYQMIASERSARLRQNFHPPFAHFSPNDYPALTNQLSLSGMEVKLETEASGSVERKLMNALISWKVIHTGFTLVDLNNAKDRLIQDLSEGDNQKSEYLARSYEKHFIRNAMAPSPEKNNKLFSELLEQIDLKDIQNFARESGSLYKNTDFIFFSGPEKAVPDAKTIKALVAKVDTMKLKRLAKKRKIVTSLEDVVRMPIEDGPILDQSENSIGISTIALRNGIKLILKPTYSRVDFRSNTVFIDAFREGTLPIHNQNDYLNAVVAPEAIQFSGAGPYDKFDLEEFSRAKGLKLRFSANKQDQTIHGESNVADVNELLNLLYLYTTQPREDLEAFEAWRAMKEDQLKNEVRSSGFFYAKTIDSQWYPQIPVFKPEDLQRISKKSIYDAFNKYYSGFDDYTFIVTGDFDKENLLPVLVEKLAAFPTRKTSLKREKSKLSFPLKKMNKTIEYPGIDHAYVNLYFPVAAPTDVKTTAILELLAKALGSRTWDRLRAGSYEPSSGGWWIDRDNGIFIFMIQFDSALTNTQHMISMARKEFCELKEKGVSEEWLKQAASAEKENFGKNLESYGYLNFWPDYLCKTLELGEDPKKKVLEYEAYLDHFISLKEVNAAAKRYLSEENLQQFVLLPPGQKIKKGGFKETN